MKRHPLIRTLSLLLALLAIPFLPACGYRVYESEVWEGYYPTVLHEGEKPVRLYFTRGHMINGERYGAYSISKEIYRLYKDPEMEEAPYFELNENGYWRQHQTSGNYIRPGKKLYAEWRTKQYDLFFYKEEKYATRLHTSNSDMKEYTDIEFGGYIKYPDYAPEGYRLVGWFSEDLSVQYTDGTTPRQGYSTINEAFFPNNEICSAIRFRPKFEPIAEE